jgi:hypothetical protein
MQILRGTSDPLQSRQGALGPLEDELALALAPGRPAVEALPLHDEVGHQAEGDMMLLGALPQEGLLLGGAPVARLTAFQPQGTFPHDDPLCHLLALPVEGPDLFRTATEPVGGGVLAAVSHHKHLETANEMACRLPLGLGQLPDERLPVTAAILRELAHNVPSRVPAALEEGLRGRPRGEEDKLRLTAQAIAGRAEQR